MSHTNGAKKTSLVARAVVPMSDRIEAEIPELKLKVLDCNHVSSILVWRRSIWPIWQRLAERIALWPLQTPKTTRRPGFYPGLLEWLY